MYTCRAFNDVGLSSQVLMPWVSTPSFHSIRATSRWNQQNGVCVQRRLRSAWAFAQSDQSSLSAWRNLGSLATHWVHREDSDQLGRMPKVIRVFAGRTCHSDGFAMRQLILINLSEKITSNPTDLPVHYRTASWVTWQTQTAHVHFISSFTCLASI